ncbi:YjcB family protein, partial [Escherichia coli]|uniref:YjcB family protein n=1 Tax=Escherichia coli TaxID=562 RepID=UPI00193A2311
MCKREGLSAVLFFLASTLNIRFRRADYVGLGVTSGVWGVVSACGFALGLLVFIRADTTAMGQNTEWVRIKEINQTPPQW